MSDANTTWRLARIRRADIGGDYSSLNLDLEYAEPGRKIGGTGQGFGGYGLASSSYDSALGKTNPAKKRSNGFAGEFIVTILEAVGVEFWADLPGKFVWVQAEHTKVHRIMGVTTGIVCDPEVIAAKYRESDGETH